jgi:HD-like signal output (HDOD) protein
VIDDQELYVEALDELRHLMINISQSYLGTLDQLKDPSIYAQTLNDFFRQMHSAKSLSLYCGLKPMTRAFKAIEDALAVLRFKTGPIEEALYEWFVQLHEPIAQWTIDLDTDDLDAIAPVSSTLLKNVKFTAYTKKSGRDIAKKLNIVAYVDNPTVKEAVTMQLNQQKIPFTLVHTRDALDAFLHDHELHILLMQAQLKKEESIQLLKDLNRQVGFFRTVVLQTQSLNKREHLKFINVGVEHFANVNVAKDRVVAKKVVEIAKIHYSKQAIRFLNSPFLHQIAAIKQLPNSITEIQAIANDENASIRDLSELVASDVGFTTRLLQQINTPAIGLKGQISSIHQAVALLGKDRTTALCMQLAVEDTFTIELPAYDLNSEQFFTIAQKRMNFIFHWYRHVNLSDVGMVCTAALLGNIGQIIINDEVLERHEIEHFQDMLFSTSSYFAEVELLHTSATDVSSDILRHWGVNSELAYIIRYSMDPLNAREDLQQLVIALHVTFNIIKSIDEPIQAHDVHEMRSLIEEFGFNLKHFDQALLKIGYEEEG